MSTCNEYAEFLATLCLETGARPHRVAPLARRLRRLATTHHRRCEVQCNGCHTCKGWGYIMRTPISDMGCADYEVGARPCPTCSTNIVEQAIRGVCGELAALRQTRDLTIGVPSNPRGGMFIPHFQGDPRGATVKLRLPSGTTNDMGREGYCVPTSR